MRLPSGIPARSLPRWWYRIRYGNTLDLQDPRGVPGPNYVYVLRHSFPEGVRYRRRALQRCLVLPSVGRERRSGHDDGQRGALRYLLPNAQVDWQFEPASDLFEDDEDAAVNVREDTRTTVMIK